MGARKPFVLLSLLLAAFAINLDTTIVNVVQGIDDRI
jgi:putative Mn2+ efflux pump MntP